MQKIDCIRCCIRCCNWVTVFFSLQKNAIAVAHCKKGVGILKVNGNPIELLQPETLRYKIFEPVLLVGREKFQGIDIRIRVKGGGHTSQVYGESMIVVCLGSSTINFD